MNAREWEGWLRKQAEETLKVEGDIVNVFLRKNPQSDDSTLRVRLQFISDSKNFTDAQIQRLEALWQRYDSVITVAEALRFRQLYGRGSL